MPLALYCLTNITQTIPAYSSSYSQSHTRGKWPIWQFFDVDLMLLTPHGVSKSYFTTKAPIPRSLEGHDQNHPFVQTKKTNINWGGTVPIEVAIIAPMPFMKYTLTYIPGLNMKLHEITMTYLCFQPQWLICPLQLYHKCTTKLWSLCWVWWRWRLGRHLQGLGALALSGMREGSKGTHFTDFFCLMSFWKAGPRSLDPSSMIISMEAMSTPKNHHG